MTLGLGSCIGICIYDRFSVANGLGGLAHIMLPDSSQFKNGVKAEKFADLAIPKMVEELQTAGGQDRGRSQYVPVSGQEPEYGYRGTEYPCCPGGIAAAPHSFAGGRYGRPFGENTDTGPGRPNGQSGDNGKTNKNIVIISLKYWQLLAKMVLLYYIQIGIKREGLTDDKRGNRQYDSGF